MQPKVVLISNKQIEDIRTLTQIPYPCFISRVFGFGPARNYGAKHYGNSGLMVQFNDDLVLNPRIWGFIQAFKRGEFGLQIVDEWVCSRVFVIHLEDYWKVGGCMENIKFAFEDGDFYLRALQAGLRFRRIPSNLAIHIPHQHSWMSMKNIAKIDSEWSRLFVKYKRNAKRNMFAFFIRPFHWKVVFQHFVLKVFFTNYWLLRGLIR